MNTGPLQMEFYLKFQRAHLEVIVGKSSFEILQLLWAKKMKERNVCYCIYYVEIQKLLVELNMHAKFGQHGPIVCNCNCKVCDSNECGCVTELCTYSRTSALWKSILCSSEELSEWHNCACIFGECQYYKIETLLVCPNEKGVPKKLVSWKRFAMETFLQRKVRLKKNLPLYINLQH